MAGYAPELMLPPFCIHDALTPLKDSLSLTWHTEQTDHNKQYLDLSHFQNWIDRFHPDQHHVIEIIDQDNHALLSSWLLQNSPASIWLVCNDVTIPDVLLSKPAQAIHNIMCTPLTASEVIHNLSFYLAEKYCVHRQEHGVFMQIHGLGILLRGKPGIGKSSLALELLDRGHQLVADDSPLFYRFPASTYIYGICPPVLLNFLQVRDLGVINVNKLISRQTCAPLHALHLVIELSDEMTDPSPLVQSPTQNRVNILDVPVPVVRLHTPGGRNLAVMVETITRNHVLYMDGYDANQALSIKLQQKLKDTTK